MKTISYQLLKKQRDHLLTIKTESEEITGLINLLDFMLDELHETGEIHLEKIA